MTEIEQRREELENAEDFFRRHFGIVPVFEALPLNSRPDVCVLFQGKRIGIELTRALDRDTAKHDSFAQRVLQAAKVQHASRSGVHGRVTVSLQQGCNPDNIERNNVGAMLGDLVADQWPTGRNIAIIQPEGMPPKVSEVFSKVVAFCNEGAISTRWETDKSFSVQPISVERLQPIITKKNAKLADYRRMGCDELWLLIYARPLKIAEQWDFAAGFDPSELISGFDRTFFYDFWRSLELPARRLME